MALKQINQINCSVPTLTVKRLVDMAGKKTPWMLDPRPNSYIGEFRDDYTDLDYHPKQKKLVIEGLGEFSV